MTTSRERRLSRGAIAAPSVRRDHWLLPAQDRVTLPELGLVDARSLAVLAEVEPPALPKDRYRVLPYDRLDVSLGDPGRAHRVRRLWHLQWVADAPVGSAVDGDALATVALDELDHARLVHLGFRIDRVACPVPIVERQRQGLLRVVVDQHLVRIDAARLDHVD